MPVQGPDNGLCATRLYATPASQTILLPIWDLMSRQGFSGAGNPTAGIPTCLFGSICNTFLALLRSANE